MKYVAPSTSSGSFNCPYCGVLTSQSWNKIFVGTSEGERNLPQFLGGHTYEALARGRESAFENNFAVNNNTIISGEPQINNNATSSGSYAEVWNLNLSKCYSCGRISVWVQDRLVFPHAKTAPPSNPDLPGEIRADYEEASSILDASPRGAAALIRLTIQKLCKHLGEKGRNINDDIASLVKKGLDVRVQKALDAVRVIGNNAVHPGQIDLKDDRATAESLFRLLNLIADKMISEPKHVDDVYDLLPEEARDAIEKRDRKAE